MAIPIITFFANVTILFDIPLLREIIVFIFLSFIPGFVILRLFKLKENNVLETVLFSLGLSIALVMFMGFFVNELYLIFGLSQPLSTVPLTVAISAFTLTVFFIEYRRDLSETSELKTGFERKSKTVLLFSAILFLLPILSAIGFFYVNIFIILLSDAIIASLCVMSVVSRKLVPQNLFPLLIFSISITLAFQNPLTSKYVTGYDAHAEYYVFRLTQMNGHWGFLDANLHELYELTYNSMLSITLLPAIYSSLMNAKNEIVFKVLYPFILSLVPLSLYQICEKQFGKLIGLLSVFFFIFTSTAFFGPEPLGLNRQTVGELFLLLSVFLLVDKTIPVAKRRLLLIIFGAALIVSHYSLAYLYMGMVAVIFIISRVKSGFDETLNAVTVGAIFLMTFLWYTAGQGASFTSLILNLQGIFLDLISGNVAPKLGSASAVFYVPQAFSVATYINVLLVGIANLFLIIGALAIVLKLKGKGVSAGFRAILAIAAVMLVVSLVIPRIAASLNFTRFYGVTLLFLSVCFVLGGETLLETIGKVWTKIRRPLQRQIASKSKNIDIVFVAIAIILGGYFLSQVGFVNRVTGGSVQYYNTNFDKMIASNETPVKIGLYAEYIPEQDAFSASWLSTHKVETTEVFCDLYSGSHALTSYGLIPSKLLPNISWNGTIPTQGSVVYLGSLNIVNGVIITKYGSFNTSEISSILDRNSLVYSNGNNEILCVSSGS